MDLPLGVTGDRSHLELVFRTLDSLNLFILWVFGQQRTSLVI